MHDALRLNLNWFTGGVELPGQLGAVINACMAVACGLAKHVLVFRSVWEATAQGSGGRAPISGGVSEGGGKPPRAVGPMLEFTLPFRAYSAANWVALIAQRHFHEYGTTREQLAQIALTARKNAAGNPKAVYKEPMTLESYFAARMISTPFCLFDCDVPVDGATAVIVSRADAARDLRRPPIKVEAVGSALHGRPSWDQFDDLTTMAMRDAGAMLWTRTDLKPSDVQVAELYDGFSFLALALARRPGLLPQGRGRSLHRGRQAHRARRRAAAQHQRRSALGRKTARLRLHPRGVRAAVGRGWGASGAGRSAGRGGRRGRRSAGRLPALDESMMSAPAIANPAASPDRLGPALVEFFRHASPRVLVALVAAAVAVRVLLASWSLWDLAILLALVAFWPLQEWLIHVFILHYQPVTLFGRKLDFKVPRLHRAHHQEPWRLDLVFIPIHVFAFVPLVVGGIALLGASQPQLVATWAVAHFALSLHYEWVHFMIHTRYRPAARLLPAPRPQSSAAPLPQRALLVWRDDAAGRRLVAHGARRERRAEVGDVHDAHATGRELAPARTRGRRRVRAHRRDQAARAVHAERLRRAARDDPAARDPRSRI